MSTPHDIAPGDPHPPEPQVSVSCELAGVAAVDAASELVARAGEWMADRVEWLDDGRSLLCTYDEEYGYMRRTRFDRVRVRWRAPAGAASGAADAAHVVAFRWGPTVRVGGAMMIPASPGQQFAYEWRSGLEPEGAVVAVGARDLPAGGGCTVELVEFGYPSEPGWADVIRRQERFWRHQLSIFQRVVADGSG